jgi:hypothetical protein
MVTYTLLVLLRNAHLDLSPFTGLEIESRGRTECLATYGSEHHSRLRWRPDLLFHSDARLSLEAEYISTWRTPMNLRICSCGNSPLQPSVHNHGCVNFSKSFAFHRSLCVCRFTMANLPADWLRLPIMFNQEERRQAHLASFARFGYNEAMRAAIVDSLNLQSPASLARFTDERLANLADQLLKYYAPCGRAAIPANGVRIPLTVLDDLRAYKK